MRRKSRYFYYIILLVFCLVLQGSNGVMAISEVQKNAIVDHCEEMRDDLRRVQKDDARVRVHLGSGYETILSRFITPLNVRLVENNLSSAELVENQNEFAKARATFSDDYVSYQQKLEELVLMDCKREPEGFYEKLVKVRQKRKVVDQDVSKLRELISQHVRLVNDVMKKL